MLQALTQEFRCNQPPYTTWNLGGFEMPKKRNTELFLHFLISSRRCITVLTLLQSK